MSNPGFTPSATKHPLAVSEEQVISRLRRLMKVNLKSMCYQDAIFFADKLLHLQHARTDHFVRAVYDLGKSTNLIFYIAHCYMLNKEHLRCVQLVEKYELAFHSEKFRILTA